MAKRPSKQRSDELTPARPVQDKSVIIEPKKQAHEPATIPKSEAEPVTLPRRTFPQNPVRAVAGTGGKRRTRGLAK